MTAEPRTYKVSTMNAAGQWVTEEHVMSPEMARIMDEMKAFNDANPDFWCKCAEPETGMITPRGHSVDVDCRKCGGCLQVG